MADHLILILAASAGILTITILLISLMRVRRRKSFHSQSHYIAGLNRMIAGDHHNALESLRKEVRKNTDNVDAYIKIGDILRKSGASDQAVRIHRDLLVRPNVNPQQHLDILRSLVLDYREGAKYDSALQICDQLIELDKRDSWTRAQKLELCEFKKDWNAAFQILKHDDRYNKTEKEARLACYKLEEGVSLADKGQEHDARVRFRDAMKLAPRNPAAYLQLADSYVREQRARDAVPVLEKLIKTCTDYSDLALMRLEQVLFDMGHFGDIEKVYLDIVKNQPKVIEAHLGLADIYEKKGELRKAVSICQRAFTIDADSLPCRLKLMKLYRKLGQHELASEIGEKLSLAQPVFTCTKCGHQSTEYFWHCPGCRAWNSADRGVRSCV